MMQHIEKPKGLAAGLARTIPVQSALGNFFSKNSRDSSYKLSEKGLGSKTRKILPEKLEANLPSDRRSENHWAAKDTEEYRNRYPGKKDQPEKRDNLLFYTNQIKSEPDPGAKIDEIHSKWFGNYELLEGNHGYIQWLFPVRKSGVNRHSQELQLHEIDAIMKDTKARGRILMSYKMMLDFYGMKLQDEETGEIVRAENWKERFQHLNRSRQNYLCITRILKCLGEFGYEHLEPPFVKFVLREGYETKTLDNLIESCERYWIEVIRDEKARDEIWNYYDSLYLEKYAEELTDDSEQAPAAQEQKQDERQSKVQANRAGHGDSDQDNMDYAKSIVSCETNYNDGDVENRSEGKVAKTDKKVLDLSNCSDDSQGAKYWQANCRNSDQDMEIDQKADNEINKHSHDSNDELVTPSKRNKEEVINAGDTADEMVSEGARGDQNNDMGSDETNEMGKDTQNVEKRATVDKDGNCEDVVTETSGQRSEEINISDREYNYMIQEADEHSKSGNTENIETGTGETKEDTSCKDDDQGTENDDSGIGV